MFGRLADQLEEVGPLVRAPRRRRKYTIEGGLRMSVVRRTVIPNDEGLLRDHHETVTILNGFARSTAHLVAASLQDRSGLEDDALAAAELC